MYPSEIRNRILAEHAVFRERLDVLETHLDTLEDDSVALRAVALEAKQLLARLDEHTRLEDAVLAPALRDVDSWGPARADSLLSHHEAQRAEFGTLVVAYEGTRDVTEIARLTRSLIADLRSDMQHEEREILSSNLLRDDLVTADCETG